VVELPGPRLRLEADPRQGGHRSTGVDKLGLTWLLEAILSLPVIGGPSLSISYIGTFLVFTLLWLPFMILPIQAALERVPRR
jgi:ABC-type spermidine/putrescine transport system permease subunit I